MALTCPWSVNYKAIPHNSRLTAQAPLRRLRHGICVAKMLDNVGLRYPHRASGAKAPRTLRPLPLLRFAVSATGGAHLCSIQYYLRFWLSICRTSLAVSALRIMRYCHNKTKNPGTIFIPKSCRDLYYSMRSRLKFFAKAFFQKGWKGKLKINPCSFCWWPSCAGRGPGCACGCAGSPE